MCTGELTELAAAIRSEAETLYKSWLGTSERVRDWQQKIATATKVGVPAMLTRGHGKRFEECIKNCQNTLD